MFMKMATKVGMYSATHESVTVAREQRQENYTALRTKKTAGFVTVPSEKKVRCSIKEFDCEFDV